MTLPEEAVKEFQEIYHRLYGESLSYQEALERAIRMIRLFRLISRPIPIEWLKKHKTEYENTT